MKLTLRPDCYRVATEGGVYVLAHHGTVRLDGRSVGEWLDRLAPYLDGRYDLAELLARAPAARREAVERALRTLIAGGVVREHGTGGTVVVDDPAKDAETRYASYFIEDAAAAVERYRAVDAVVVGDGPLVPALAAAASRSGVRSVAVPVGPGWSPVDRLLDRGCAEVVLQVLSSDDRRTALVEDACARHGAWLSQVVCTSDSVWVLPLRAPGSDPAQGMSWRGVRARADAVRPVVTAHPDRPGWGESTVAGTTAAVTASFVVQRLFNAYAGSTAQPATDEVVLIRPGLGGRSTHRVVPHPFDRAVPPPAEDPATRLHRLRTGPPVTDEAVALALPRYRDERFGLVTLDELDLPQVPLKQYQAVPATKAEVDRTTAPPASVGIGFERRRAGCRAAAQALAHYALRTFDPRRAVDPAGRPYVCAGGDPWDADQPAGAAPAMVWGYQLPAGAPRLVRAERVYPQLAPTLAAPVDDLGLGVGYDWAEAVQNALLSHLRRRELPTRPGQGGRWPCLDLALVELTGPAERAHSILQRLGELPDVYEVSDAGDVPTLAFYRSEPVVEYATAASVPAAVADVLERALLAVQLERAGHTPPGTVHPGSRARARTHAGDPGRPRTGPIGPTGMAELLARQGHDPVVVPLDHDPEVSSVLPYIVKVVLEVRT